MLTFDQLTPVQQTKAIKLEVSAVINQLVDGSLRPVGGEFLKKFQEACDKCERMGTPWFLGEYIYEACYDFIRGPAEQAARHYLYATDEDPPVVELRDVEAA